MSRTVVVPVLAFSLAALACSKEPSALKSSARPADGVPATAPGATAPPSPTAPVAPPDVLLTPDGQPAARVTVELARTEGERARGLMYRQNLPLDAGMLFLFDADEVQTFWMKNTLIPLDMIFIRGDMSVVGVVENAEPLTLKGRTVGQPSKYVLEVNGGWAKAHGVKAGTHVAFENVAP